MDWLVRLVQSVVFQTVVSGVLVFVLGEYIQNFIILPIQEHKKVIAKIDNKLKFYSNVITNPFRQEDLKDQNVLDRVRYISRTIRNLSCDLEVSFRQQPSFLKSKDRQKRMSEAAALLIGLSNGLVGPYIRPLDNSNRIDTIRELLNIPSLVPE